MKYKVTTSYLIGAGDISHEDEWLFDTKEEAQKFVDDFLKEFPEDDFCMDYPSLVKRWGRDYIEEVDDTRADPYAWLEKQKKYKEEHIKKYGR